MDLAQLTRRFDPPPDDAKPSQVRRWGARPPVPPLPPNDPPVLSRRPPSSGALRRAGRRRSAMNRVLLTGRLTRDPEMRVVSNGKNVTQFSIATNEYRGGAEKAEFHVKGEVYPSNEARSAWTPSPGSSRHDPRG